jgi:uncharacterized protein YcnI/copper(I)-binding protein
MSRLSRACALSAISAGLFVATSAFAHITLEKREAKAGSSYKVVLKVPHGCDGSPIVRLRAEIPEGIVAVKPMPKPGWTIETKKGAYEKTYAYYHGAKLSEGVKEIVWTGKLLDEHYDEFVFSAYVARELKPGMLYIPVTQTCEKGEIAWIEKPAAGQDAHALKRPAPALTILAQSTQHAGASETSYKVGALTIKAPWVRATPKGAAVAGGYMTITNNGKNADRLIGGTFPSAARLEVHEMSTEGGVMKMRMLPNGIEIKPGETVELKPGGLHVMFTELKDQVQTGTPVKGTLVFEKAGTIEVEYQVAPVGAPGPSGGGMHSHH